MKTTKKIIVLVLLSLSLIVMAAPSGPPDFAKGIVCGIIDVLRGAGIPIPEGFPPFCAEGE